MEGKDQFQNTDTKWLLRIVERGYLMLRRIICVGTHIRVSFSGAGTVIFFKKTNTQIPKIG